MDPFGQTGSTLMAFANSHRPLALFGSRPSDFGSVTGTWHRFAWQAGWVSLATTPGCLPRRRARRFPLSLTASFGANRSASQPVNARPAAPAAAVPASDVRKAVTRAGVHE